MSHVTPLSLSKECIVHCRIVCLSGLVMLPSLLSCRPMFKGKLNNFYLYSQNSLCVSTFDSIYDYLIHIILELSFEFCVVDVGLIMALLRRDYSCRHQLIIQENSLRNNIQYLEICMP